MERIKSLSLLPAIIMTLELFAFSYEPASAQQHRKVLVAYVAPGISQTIPWVTKEAGIFTKHGVDADVILLTGSPRLVQTLLAGDIDYSLGGVSSVLRARFRGADPVILATTGNFSSQQVLVRPESPLQHLQDLKGKIVGVTQYGSQGDTFVRDALKKTGLRPDADVTLIQMGGTPQVGSALLAGKIDAGVTGESGLLLVQQGRAKQLPGASAKELKIAGSGATLSATRRHIARDRDGVMKFLRAYVEGVHYFKTNREGSLRALQRFFRGASAEQVAFFYDNQREVFDPLPIPSDEAIQGELDRETDPKAKTFKPADFMDLSFLREIEKSGFLAELYGKGSNPAR
ncbi:MAG TPA: ABC transporter substrate-binding protein [Candidatus Binatia bacterium]|nr:ABC transporter substrate-binding protein [Candidatus Binatia bacterium]